ncbi:peptide chain release factor N(5)-glutamine methyltransferase [Proteiniclasticum sp. C24MP]|uniref:peptide chain release factor N(5)-glutamine methyltransferase n=1 Tax=Proteiniclasticum sp. C24MP TaxID=3374101 RepID=UPI003753EDFF
MLTIGDAVKLAAEKLKEISDTPSLDGRILLKEVTEKDEVFLLTHRETLLSEEEEREYLAKLSQREKGMPIAYIVGYKEFMGFRFKVNEHTLIPRPDTEIAVEKAIEMIREKKYRKVLDLCSGSGAIGLSIAGILEFTNVTLSDINKGAISVSMENAEHLGVQQRVKFIQSDLFEKIDEKYDLIVSNPPYISGEDMEELSVSVKEYEPHSALYGGARGLDFYEEITKNAEKHLTENGMLIFEIGYDQSQEVEKMLKENGFKNIITLKDLSGHHRVVSGELLPET